MSKFDYPSRYYADDKDVSDLLTEPKFNSKSLQKLLKGRGIFVSSELSREALIEYISQLPFSWRELIALLHEIETEEKEDHKTTGKFPTTATVAQFQDAIKEIQKLRGQSNSEVYNINATGDDIFVVVKYRELDHRSTRTLQWTDHTMEIHAKKTDKGFDLRYSATERGEDVVNAVLDKLADAEKKPKTVETIHLNAISDSIKRTQFFRSLVYGVAGLRPENVKDVRLNRVQVDPEGKAKLDTEELTLDDEQGDEPDEPAAPAGKVRKTTFSGDSIFQAPEFQEFCKQGFFVSKVLWTAMEKDGAGRKFEFESEFKDAENGSGFRYRLRGQWLRDEDGELSLKRSAIGNSDRRQLSDKLEAAAYAALAEITASPKVENATNAVPAEAPKVESKPAKV